MLKLKLIFLILYAFSFSVLAEEKSPALWKLSDEDTTIHLLGSIHVLKPGTIWLNDDLQSLVSNAKALYFELSADQQSPQVMQPLVMKYGLLSEDDTLKNHLPKGAYQDLSSAFTSLGMPEQNFMRFKPWMAGVVYSVVKFGKLGFNPAAGVEATLVGLAQAKGIKIEGLETAEYQISMLDGLSDEEELEMIMQLLQDKDELGEMMEIITSSWTSGNLTTLENIFVGSFKERPELKEKLLLSRNRNWIPKIKEILDQPGDYMVIVGTAHLVGEGSVINLLKKENIPVLRVH